MIITQILHAEGEKVEMLIMLDGSPTLFQRPKFRDHTRGRIMEGSLRSDVRYPIFTLDFHSYYNG